MNELIGWNIKKKFATSGLKIAVVAIVVISLVSVVAAVSMMSESYELPGTGNDSAPSSDEQTAAPSDTDDGSSSGGTEPTSTASPNSVDYDAASASEFDFPDGTSADGIRNPKFLMSTHRATLTTEGYVLEWKNKETLSADDEETVNSGNMTLRYNGTHAGGSGTHDGWEKNRTCCEIRDFWHNLSNGKHYTRGPKEIERRDDGSIASESRSYAANEFDGNYRQNEKLELSTLEINRRNHLEAGSPSVNTSTNTVLSSEFKGVGTYPGGQTVAVYDVKGFREDPKLDAVSGVDLPSNIDLSDAEVSGEIHMTENYVKYVSYTYNFTYTLSTGMSGTAEKRYSVEREMRVTEVGYDENVPRPEWTDRLRD